MFSAMNFIKNKHRNCLENHLELCVRAKVQHFYTLHSFPFDKAVEAWIEAKRRYGGVSV